MDKKHYEYIEMIAMEKSFSRAAAKLFISQPSLSQFVRRIEQQYDVKFFTHNNNEIELSKAGKLYLNTCKQIINLEICLKNSMKEIATLQKGQVTIGITPYRDCYFLSDFFKTFTTKYPHVNIYLTESKYSELELRLLRGDIDVMFAILPVNNDNFKSLFVMSEEIYMVMAKNYWFLKENGITDMHTPKSKYPEVSLSNFKDAKFIMQPSSNILCERIIELCHLEGFEPNVILESRSPESNYSMAVSGLGITFIPESFIKNSHSMQSVTCFSIKKYHPIIEMSLFYNKNKSLSNAAAAFIQQFKYLKRKNK